MINPKLIDSHSSVSQVLYDGLGIFDVVYLNGMPSVGKTTLAKHALKITKHNYVYIDCNELSTPIELLTSICKQLLEKIRNKGLSDNYGSKTITLTIFTKFIKEYSDLARVKFDERSVIALDDFDKLKRTPIVDTVLYLNSIPNICLLLISRDADIIDVFKCPSQVWNIQEKMLSITIPPFSKEDLIKIIVDKSKISKMPMNSFKTFTNNMVITHYVSTTKDLLELMSMCHDEFPKYHESQVNRKKNNTSPKKSRENCGDEAADSTTHMLYISAYIASFSKPSHDKINFGGATRGKTSSRRAKLEDNQPIQFTLERLAQIHRSLWYLIYDNETRYELPDYSVRKIGRMEALGKIRQVGGSELNSTSKFKMTSKISKSFVNQIMGHFRLKIEDFNGLY